MIRFQIWQRITEAFQALATGGSENPMDRGQLFEELARQTYLMSNPEVTTVISSYWVSDFDRTVRVDATSGPITVNLQPAALSTGTIVTIKKVDSSANEVTVDANLAETIDGALTVALTAQYQKVTLQSNGTSWDVL